LEPLDPEVLRWLLERKFSLKLLRQFTELRISIEPAAAELAARVATAERFEPIYAAYNRMATAQDGKGESLEARHRIPRRPCSQRPGIRSTASLGTS
jgi:DNA-binding FadR family transcriptional regulator